MAAASAAASVLPFTISVVGGISGLSVAPACPSPCLTSASGACHNAANGRDDRPTPGLQRTDPVEQHRTVSHFHAARSTFV